jgi:hypothetical protein
MVNRVTSSNSSLALKVIGIICILSFFVDFAVLLLGFSATDNQSQIAVTTGIVDRGIVPMIGIGLILAAYGLDNSEQGSSSGLNLRVPSLILACVLGGMFLVIFPFHLRNVGQARTERVAQIEQRAEQQENQLNNQLNQFLERLNNDQGQAQIEQVRNQAKSQFTALLQDEARYKQALEDPNIPAQQKELLKKFKANPAELDKFIAQQTDPNQVTQQRINRIREQREEEQKQVKEGAWKSSLRIGISSLLLFLGYAIIGVTGLKGTGGLKGGKRKAPAR